MSHAIAVVAICAVVTIALRALPFVCFGGKKGVPRLVSALGETLPPAIMAALVVYCLKSVPFGTFGDGARQLIAAAAVVARTCGRKIRAQHRRGNGAVHAAHSRMKERKP